MNRIFALFAAIAITTGCNEEAPIGQDALPTLEAPELATSLDRSVPSQSAEAFDPCAAQEPGSWMLDVPGFEDRPALVMVPEVDGPRDAVVMLHGGGNDGERARTVTRYASAAADRGMVAVFPDGVDSVWRAGFTDFLSEEDVGGIDDVAYLSALSDALSDEVCVDRVLGAGFSNGSMMVQRWACEGTGIDAVVASSGTRLEHACTQPAVPIVYTHGTADPRVTYDGSVSEQTGRAWPSVDHTIDTWLDHNKWDGFAPVESISGPIECLTWTGDADVTLCKIAGWGHRWPGGRNVPVAQLDLTLRSLDWFATQMDAVVD